MTWTGQEEGTGHQHKCSGQAREGGDRAVAAGAERHGSMEGVGQSPVGRRRGCGDQEKPGWEGAQRGERLAGP